MRHHKFGNRSLTNLQEVHPSLVEVCTKALIISPYDFGIICGLRSEEAQKAHVASGASTTINSRHLMQRDGYAHAVDIAVFVDGVYTEDVKYYRKVIQAFFTAAIALGVQIEAGGLWRDLVDAQHIQLMS